MITKLKKLLGNAMLDNAVLKDVNSPPLDGSGAASRVSWTPLKKTIILTYEAVNAKLETILSDNRRDFCGPTDRHPYELFLELKDIERLTRP